MSGVDSLHLADSDEGADARRALSAKYAPVSWPPRVGARIHYNSGWAHTSWSAEVRGIVDHEVAVVFRTCPAGGRSRYAFVDRLDVQVWGHSGGALRYGPLPRALCVKAPR